MELNLSPSQAPGEMTQLPVVKAEAPEVSQFLKVMPGKHAQERLLLLTARQNLEHPCLSKLPLLPQMLPPF